MTEVFKGKSCELAEEEAPSEPIMVHDDNSNGDLEEVVADDGPSTIFEGPIKVQALSASGLQALRYARQVEGLDKVVALDNDPEAVEACRRNIKFNGTVACAKVGSRLTDARVYTLTHPKEFDMVDLDPYGSPSIYLDSTIQSVMDGGMLMCTATDMAVLCGGNAEVYYSKMTTKEAEANKLLRTLFQEVRYPVIGDDKILINRIIRNNSLSGAVPEDLAGLKELLLDNNCQSVTYHMKPSNL